MSKKNYVTYVLMSKKNYVNMFLCLKSTEGPVTPAARLDARRHQAAGGYGAFGLRPLALG